MAKTKRNFPTAKFFLKYPKDYSNETLYPIFIQYTWNRNVLKRTTEIKCRVSDWNEKGFNGRGELKSCYRGDYQHDNHYLQKMLMDMDNQMSLYAQQHPNSMSTDVVRVFYVKIQINLQLFFKHLYCYKFLIKSIFT